MKFDSTMRLQLFNHETPKNEMVDNKLTPIYVFRHDGHH